MSFNPNKTPIEIIKEGAFGGTYFRDMVYGIVIVGKSFIFYVILILNYI